MSPTGLNLCVNAQGAQTLCPPQGLGERLVGAHDPSPGARERERQTESVPPRDGRTEAFLWSIRGWVQTRRWALDGGSCRKDKASMSVPKDTTHLLLPGVGWITKGPPRPSPRDSVDVQSSVLRVEKDETSPGRTLHVSLGCGEGPREAPSPRSRVPLIAPNFETETSVCLCPMTTDARPGLRHEGRRRTGTGTMSVATLRTPVSLAPQAKFPETL